MTQPLKTHGNSVPNSSSRGQCTQSLETECQPSLHFSCLYLTLKNHQWYLPKLLLFIKRKPVFRPFCGYLDIDLCAKIISVDIWRSCTSASFKAKLNTNWQDRTFAQKLTWQSYWKIATIYLTHWPIAISSPNHIYLETWSQESEKLTKCWLVQQIFVRIWSFWCFRFLLNLHRTESPFSL